MRLRSTLSATAVLAASVALTGCADEVAPPVTAYADPAQLSAYQNEGFAAQMSRMDTAVGDRNPYDGQPLNATYHGYNHYTLGDETFGKEAKSAIAGVPPAFISEFASNREGNTLNYYHPANSEWTYYLLGERYQSIAPTPWVQVPYVEPTGGEAPYTNAYCDTIPLNYLCTIRGAIDTTAESDRSAEVRHHVSHGTDGHTELRTQVTWDSLVDNDLMPITLQEDVLEAVPAALEEQLIPVRLWLDEDGFPIKGEINVAHNDGTLTFQMQSGFEYLGPASEADFVEPPSVLDVTEMDARAFHLAVATLDEEAKG